MNLESVIYEKTGKKSRLYKFTDLKNAYQFEILILN